MTNRKSIATVIGVGIVALALGLTGCSKSVEPPVADGAPTAADTAELQIVGSGVEDLPALAEGASQIVSDVAITDCTAGPGAVTATGTVYNYGDEARDLLVVAQWLVPSEDNKVVAQSSALAKEVPAGESRTFSISNSIDVEGLCSISAQSGHQS